MSQFVYVLEDKNTHLLKVGISIDPEFRAKQISKDFGCEATVVGVLEVQDARRTEQFIHGMLSGCRVVGEWFEVPDSKRGYLLAYFSDKPAAPPTRKWVAPYSKPQISEPMPDATGFEQVRDAVKAALERKGLTQAELARQVGMERGNLNRLISGTSGKVPDNWQRILDALDLELIAIPKR